MAYTDPNDERAKAAKKKYYEANKAKYAASKMQRVARNQLFIVRYLRNNSCPCGEGDIRCLEFDHLDPSDKSANINRLVADGLSIERIKEEIEKCRVLCANCHAKRTSAQFGYYKEAYFLFPSEFAEEV